MPSKTRRKATTADKPKQKGRAPQVEVPAGISKEDAPPPTDATALALRDRELVPRDPLQLYMAEVKRHPLLSREDEQKLARRYRSTGDLEAAYRLVAANLRLVVK